MAYGAATASPLTAEGKARHVLAYLDPELECNWPGAGDVGDQKVSKDVVLNCHSLSCLREQIGVHQILRTRSQTARCSVTKSACRAKQGRMLWPVHLLFDDHFMER